MAAAALARIFGGSGKKGEVPSPQMAIQKLRETEEMLGKKSEFLEKKIGKEMAAAKRHGMKNKRGVCVWGGGGGGCCGGKHVIKSVTSSVKNDPYIVWEWVCLTGTATHWHLQNS